MMDAALRNINETDGHQITGDEGSGMGHRPGELGRKLRVLHLGRVGFIGGAERVLLTIAGAGRSYGVETFLACPPGQLAQEAQRSGLPVAIVAFSRMQITANPLKYFTYAANRASSARKLVSLCRELAIDVLHVHHPVTALYCERAAAQLGIPIVLHLHEGLPGRILYKLALRRAARFTKKIVCVSSAGLKLLRAAGGNQSNAIVVLNGINIPSVRSASRLIEVRGKKQLRIAVIGLIEPRKGQDIFVEAIARITALYPEMRCFVIGDTPTNGAADYKQRLRDQVARLGLHGTVEFVPYQPDIAERMGSYDIVVSSSIGLESLSLVVLEAMSHGCVVVSTKLGGIGDVVQHGVNGFLAEPGSVQSLALSVEAAIMSDRPCVGAAARQTIVARFSAKKMCTAVTAVYHELAPVLP